MWVGVGGMGRSAGMAHSGSQESIMLSVQVFSKLVDITLVATVEIFTPWKWANAINQGYVSQRAIC